MGQAATRSSGAAPRPPPPVRWRVRVRGGLRWLKRRWRASFAHPLPRWPDPIGHSRQVLLTRDADRFEIRAETVGQLRTWLADGQLPGQARGVEVIVSDWQAPWPHWSGRLGPLPALVHHELHLPGNGHGPATVRVRVGDPVALRVIVGAVLPVLEPCRALPVTASPEVSAGADPPPWLGRGASGPDPDAADDNDAVIRPCDVWLNQTAEPSGQTYGLGLVASPYGVTAPGGQESIIVDATAATPRGRQRYGADLPRGVLTLLSAAGGFWWQICDAAEESTVIVAGRVGDPLDERQSAALRRLGAVLVSPAAPAPARVQAAVIAQLAMTGVLLHAPGLADEPSALLAGDLLTLLRTQLPAAGADPIDWEIRSIAQRREAIRRHATAFALPASAATAYPSLARPPTVSALLVTRRPQHVAAAVAALAAQRYPELEIVVGVHGFDLPAGQRTQLTAHGVPVRVMAIPAELAFGEALGVVTRAACGSLITKVDDDDRYGPEHIWDLVLARHYSGATLVGKGAEFVYLQPYDVTVRRRMGSELYTDVVAGGTMLLSRGDLDDVGWRPLARSVDRGLLDRVLRAGGLVYRTHGFGFIYTRHTDGHTWDPGFEYFMADPRQQWRGLPPYQEFA